MNERTLFIDPQHPAFAGHFPGHPIVPGVVLLDLVHQAIEQELGLAVTGLASAKFLLPLAPGDQPRLQSRRQGLAVHFTLSLGERKVAEGRFELAAEDTP